MNDHQTRLFVSAQGLRRFLQLTTVKLEIIHVNYAILQVKAQKQATKVVEIPLWLENILFDCPAAIKRNDGTVKITTFFTG